MITICNEFSQNKVISVEENKRVFRVVNSSAKNINKVKVDGCYISSSTKCDWLFEILENEAIKNIFYVELKGSDISHAIVQLEATIKHCKQIHGTHKRESYIVASKFPKAGTSSQVYKKNFLAKHKIQLFIDTNIKEVII